MLWESAATFSIFSLAVVNSYSEKGSFHPIQQKVQHRAGVQLRKKSKKTNSWYNRTEKKFSKELANAKFSVKGYLGMHRVNYMYVQISVDLFLFLPGCWLFPLEDSWQILITHLKSLDQKTCCKFAIALSLILLKWKLTVSTCNSFIYLFICLFISAGKMRSAVHVNLILNWIY